MAVSEAQKRATNKYQSKHYTLLSCKVKKEYAETIKAACAAAGTTPAAVIKSALDAFLKQQQGTTGPDPANDANNAAPALDP